MNKIDEILMDFKIEFLEATEKFPKFNSEHEGYAIILEEMDELWENVKLNQSNPNRLKKIRKEAIQVGAMTLRLIYDCIERRSKK